MNERVEQKAAEQLAVRGWCRNAQGEWERVVPLSEIGDPFRYIGQRPLATIMTGGAADVYGTGATGVANFMAESYVTTEIEEGWDEFFSFDDEEVEWIEDEGWDDFSSFIQGWVRVVFDSNEVDGWLKSIGY